MHLAFTSQSHGFYLAGTFHVPGFGRLCPAFLLSVFYFLLCLGGRIGVGLGWLWWSLGVALEWLWGRNRLAINTLWGDFDVALKWLWGGFESPSRHFIIHPSSPAYPVVTL
jgi:hypothetical protein